MFNCKQGAPLGALRTKTTNTTMLGCRHAESAVCAGRLNFIHVVRLYSRKTGSSPFDYSWDSVNSGFLSASLSTLFLIHYMRYVLMLPESRDSICKEIATSASKRKRDMLLYIFLLSFFDLILCFVCYFHLSSLLFGTYVFLAE